MVVVVGRPRSLGLGIEKAGSSAVHAIRATEESGVQCVKQDQVQI